MPKVTIIYRTIPQYRLEFYNLLKEGLEKKDIKLELVYGNNAFKGRDDEVRAEWATYKRNFTLNIYRLYIIWQPCLKEVRDSDLVIVEQANKLLFNYYLILRRIFLKKKFAFWGHGINLQISRTNIFNRFKLTYINRASWWFAYTEGIKTFLINHGVDKKKITVVQNSIDTKSLNNLYNSITANEVMALKEKYRIKQSDHVFIYCGALSKEKNIQFLITACDELELKGYQFKLFIVGNGPLKGFVDKSSVERKWLIYVGPQFDRSKALYFKASDIFLLPGAVGLAILDSFAFETPLITMEYKFHGPEFEYIINGYNAVVSEENLTDYVAKIEELLLDSPKIKLLKEAAKLMIKKYNVQSMVDNFIDGIERALV